MTPEEARARTRAILESQGNRQIIQLNDDGSLAQVGNTTPGVQQGPRKRTVLHDPKGEYCR